MPEPLFCKKEALAQVFSCEFCEVSKNTFFAEHLWTTACGMNRNKIMQSKNRYVCIYCHARVVFAFNNKSILFLLIIASVTEAIEVLGLVLGFCKDCIADFFKKSGGGLIFSFLLKHAFKTKIFHLIV